MRGLAIAALLAPAACTADFLVGEGGSSGSSSSTTLPAGTSGDTIGSAEGTGTGASGSSSGGEGGSSTGASTTTGEPGSTTTDPTGEPTTTTEVPTTGATTIGDGPGACAAIDNADGCEVVPACDWYATDQCFVDACHPDAAALCSELGADACLASPICVWNEAELACLLPDCIELPYGDCTGLGACVWLGDMRTGHCEAIDCPACWELEMPGCGRTPGCTWIEGACVPD
jgi:hypothetical protein